MGQMIGFKCEGCGYTGNLRVGGIRRTYATNQPWPVYCEGCQSITTANYRSSPLICKSCGSDRVCHIDSPEIYAGNGKDTMHSWAGAEVSTSRQVLRTRKVALHGWGRVRQWFIRKLEGPSADYQEHWVEEQGRARHEILNCGYYLCPKCGEAKLRFPSNLQAKMFFD